MRHPSALAVVAITAAATVLGGCDGAEPRSTPTPTVSPSPSSTPLSAVDTRAVTVARAEFCSRVAPAAVEAALGAAPRSSSTWKNGERTELAPGVTDVAHEYGCRWRAADGTTASAWVFAAPVTPGQANGLQRAAATARGCDPVPAAPRFGSRTVATGCAAAAGRTTTFRGLFGDAWLSCALTARPEAVQRTEDWCATVLQAASE